MDWSCPLPVFPARRKGSLVAERQCHFSSSRRNAQYAPRGAISRCSRFVGIRFVAGYRRIGKYSPPDPEGNIHATFHEPRPYLGASSPCP